MAAAIALAGEAVDEDIAIDRIELEVERRCLDFRAQQPVARPPLGRFDPRLERLSGWGPRREPRPERAEAGGLPPGKGMSEVATMVSGRCACLGRSPWLGHDAALAKLSASDAEIDTLKAQIFAKFCPNGARSDHGAAVARDVLASRNLERVADLATNVAEGDLRGRSAGHQAPRRRNCG